VVILGGDLVLMGPQPAEVVDLVRELGWPGVVGNTDEMLWRPELRALRLEQAPRLAALTEVMFDRYPPFTRERLGKERLDWLTALPAEHRLDELCVVHASPGDLWRAPMPDADDEKLERTYGDLGARIVVYGHIHRPFVRRLADSLVVANSGSVGVPWDGDPRAGYLLIEEGEPQVIRVEYDVEREIAALEESGHPDVPRLAEMRRRGRPLPVEEWSR
jgi:Calcineurin-like phosphoesterase superfamily domain